MGIYFLIDHNYIITIIINYLRNSSALSLLGDSPLDNCLRRSLAISSYTHTHTHTHTHT